MLDAVKNAGNPGRSGHIYSYYGAELVYNCRKNIAELFNVPNAEQIVFTLNATQALNTAIRTLVRRDSKVLVSGFEHNAVMRCLCDIGADTEIFADKLFDREYSINSLNEKLDDTISCVIVSHVSNVFGFIQPIEEISDICREKGVPLIIDASQSAGVIPVDFQRLNCAFIAMPGHKSLMGPQGTGVLICGVKPVPLLFGGTGSNSKSYDMPDILPDIAEAGTQNVPGIAGLSAGVRYIINSGDKINAHEKLLKNIMLSELREINGVTVYSGDNVSQSGVISFNIDGTDCETVAYKLSEKGIAVRAGLHCAPLAHKSAGTLETGTVRASLSYFNKPREIFRFCDEIGKIAKKHGNR